MSIRAELPRAWGHDSLGDFAAKKENGKDEILPVSPVFLMS